MKQILRAAYKAIPLKKQIFSVLKKVWKPSESVYRHLHFTGVIDVKVENTKFRINHYGFLIENEIFWDGLENGHESVSCSLWSKLVKESLVIFDIGANTGVYSLIAASLNPQAQIFAFEPVKRIFQKLEANIALNDVEITAVEKALSDGNGQAVIYETGAEHMYSVTVNKNMEPENPDMKEVRIETVRLDTFIEENGLGTIDLMKIDVETHEPEVLAGMGKYFEKFRPALLIEILEDEVGKRVEELVSGKEYLYFNIDDKKKSLRRVDHIVKSDLWNYLICSKEKAHFLGLI
jgi:FkbM family methyltransferase